MILTIIITLLCVIPVIYIILKFTEKAKKRQQLLSSILYPTRNMDYDPSAKSLESLTRFQPVKKQTLCLYSPPSRLWGSKNWNSELSLEENVLRSIPALISHIKHSQVAIDRMYELLLGKNKTVNPLQNLEIYMKKMRELRRIMRDHPSSKRDNGLRDRCGKRNRVKNFPNFQEALQIFHAHVDGFLFEIRGRHYFTDLLTFANTVRRIITCLGEHDPYFITRDKNSRFKLKRPVETVSGNLGSRWFFNFNREVCTITTLAPLYDSSASRFMYTNNTNMDSCFFFIQSESALHFYDSGHGSTWSKFPEAPQTTRDKIRKRFWDKGQGYPFSEENEGAFPYEWTVIHPLKIGDPIVEWWKDPPQFSDKYLYQSEQEYKKYNKHIHQR